MCIAIYSLKGTDIPREDILKTCFLNNPDGAGFAFNKGGKVHIVKGFMDYKGFMAAFKKYDAEFGFKQRGVLIHFRIATHGGVNVGCCHPFSISSNDKQLKKSLLVSDYAVIHNGIIFGVFRRGNKPSVLPRDSKTSGATTKMARRMPSRKTLKREEPPV